MARSAGHVHIRLVRGFGHRDRRHRLCPLIGNRRNLYFILAIGFPLGGIDDCLLLPLCHARHFTGGNSRSVGYGIPAGFQLPSVCFLKPRYISQIEGHVLPVGQAGNRIAIHFYAARINNGRPGCNRISEYKA